jgi:hypothetical protein
MARTTSLLYRAYLTDNAMEAGQLKDQEEGSPITSLSTFCIEYCKILRRSLKVFYRSTSMADSIVEDTLATLILWDDTIRRNDDLLRSIEEAKDISRSVMRSLVTISKCVLRGMCLMR